MQSSSDQQGYGQKKADEGKGKVDSNHATRLARRTPGKRYHDDVRKGAKTTKTSKPRTFKRQKREEQSAMNPTR